jgi:hypothetical protein
VVLIPAARRWAESDGFVAWLRAVRVEEWIACGLLGMQFFFIAQARRLRRTEPFCARPAEQPEGIP